MKCAVIFLTLCLVIICQVTDAQISGRKKKMDSNPVGMPTGIYLHPIYVFRMSNYRLCLVIYEKLIAVFFWTLDVNSASSLLRCKLYINTKTSVRHHCSRYIRRRLLYVNTMISVGRHF